MLPQNNNLLNSGIEVKSNASKSYFIDFKKQKMTGITDGLEALKQAIYLILSIERYDYVIYSWNYGIELKDLFGKPTNYACAVLPSRIKQALIQDDRIQNVYDFVTSAKGNDVFVKFTIDSIFGTFSQEVKYSV
jgi:hypothetical protein